MMAHRLALTLAAAGLGLAVSTVSALAKDRYEVDIAVTKVAAMSEMNDTGGMPAADFYMTFNSPSGRRKVTERVDNKNQLDADDLERWNYNFRHRCDDRGDCSARVEIELCDKDARRRGCDRADLTPDLGDDDDGVLTIDLFPKECLLEADGDIAASGEASGGICRIEAAFEGTGSGPDVKAAVAMTVTMAPR